MIDILLADDHSIVRNGIRNLLEKEADMRVVGEVTNGIEAIKLLKTATPHILLADMNMPGLGGIELAEKLQADNSGIKVMLLTMHDHLNFVNKAFRAGACAYLLKNISPEELVFAIRQVYKGKQYLCNELSLHLLDQSLASPQMLDTHDSPTVRFSEREIAILKLIADGLTNQEIADKLFTSKRTVEGHRRAMIDNSGAKNTAALIRYALKRKIID